MKLPPAVIKRLWPRFRIPFLTIYQNGDVLVEQEPWRTAEECRADLERRGWLFPKRGG